jgi:hypothetical protein
VAVNSLSVYKQQLMTNSTCLGITEKNDQKHNDMHLLRNKVIYDIAFQRKHHHSIITTLR